MATMREDIKRHLADAYRRGMKAGWANSDEDQHRQRALDYAEKEADNLAHDIGVAMRRLMEDTGEKIGRVLTAEPDLRYIRAKLAAATLAGSGCGLTLSDEGRAELVRQALAIADELIKQTSQP